MHIPELCCSALPDASPFPCLHTTSGPYAERAHASPIARQASPATPCEGTAGLTGTDGLHRRLDCAVEREQSRALPSDRASYTAQAWTTMNVRCKVAVHLDRRGVFRFNGGRCSSLVAILRLLNASALLSSLVIDRTGPTPFTYRPLVSLRVIPPDVGLVLRIT